MVKINRHNYEIFFMDYLDGNLDENQTQMLFTFLRENPDLKEEMENISEVQLQPDRFVHFQKKNKLKKDPEILPDAISNLDELCIASLEGDLKDEENLEFGNLLEENEKFSSSYALYQKTKLVPDKSATFPEKEKLKRVKKVVPLFTETVQKTLAYAAGIILLVAFYVNISSDSLNKDYNTLSNNILLLENSLSSEEIRSEIMDPGIIDTKTTHLSIEYNNLSFNPKVEVNKFSKQTELAKLSPLNEPLKAELTTIQYAFAEPVLKIPDYYMQQQENQEQNTPITRQALAALQKNAGNSNREGFSLLDVADLGFLGINKLTGKDWEIKRFYNDKGELTKLALKAESISFTTNINKD